MMAEPKPCPFCGGKAYVYGAEIKDYVNGKWAEQTHKVFWVQTSCLPFCNFGNIRTRAYGISGGIEYKTPEAAVEAWNRRCLK